MRLIDSPIEQQCRAELVAGRTELMRGDGDIRSARLRSFLQERGANLSRAYVLHWIPEQGEDFYEVLLDSEVLYLEIPHDEAPCQTESMSLAEYRKKRHGRPGRIRLEVALDLLANDALA